MTEVSFSNQLPLEKKLKIWIFRQSLATFSKTNRPQCIQEPLSNILKRLALHLIWIHEGYGIDTLSHSTICEIWVIGVAGISALTMIVPRKTC
jgi:hypothetical protein